MPAKTQHRAELYSARRLRDKALAQAASRPSCGHDRWSAIARERARMVKILERLVFEFERQGGR